MAFIILSNILKTIKHLQIHIVASLKKEGKMHQIVIKIVKIIKMTNGNWKIGIKSTFYFTV